MVNSDWHSGPALNYMSPLIVDPVAECAQQGGRLVRIPSPPLPPPPSGPPKVLEPVFLQIEILGKMGGAIGAENFFAGMRQAVEFLNIPMCVYPKCSVRTGDFGSTPGGGGGGGRA